MSSCVPDLREIDRSRTAEVGAKAAHLGELARLDGIRVPAGFCVTTDAFRRILAGTPSIDGLLERLSEVVPDDRETIRTRSAEVRQAVEETVIPVDLATAISGAVARLGEGGHIACAVRSSATAEDLPAASFAGQQDTYLNVVGPTAILRHIGRCWASLFTERAVAYRNRNGIDHREARMAVIVQEMVFPDAAGVLFTADPATSDRTVTSVEAGFGLGEGLVSGRVNADAYKVRGGEVTARTIATKSRAVRPSPAGGTGEEPVEPARQDRPTLTDAQVVHLAQLGRRIEAHFGRPQDIEWCLTDEGVHIVQSRPVTTLFPVPDNGDGARHVYISVGHQQMMTDPMKPLGISLWQLTAGRPMHEAGGRLFVEVTEALASPESRPGLLDAVGRSDPRLRDALETVVRRGDFVPSRPEEGPDGPGGGPGGNGTPATLDPAVVTELIDRERASIEDLKAAIRTRSGPALLDFILEDIQELRRLLFDPRSHQVFTAAMDATQWLNERLEAWLGERNAADTLARSVPHNVTSEMGLALLDVADVIRPHPEVIARLREIAERSAGAHDAHEDGGDDGFLDELAGFDGGPEARDAIRAYLDDYGMRCVGEIDITRPRWAERPAMLLPTLLANIGNFPPGARQRLFDQGRQEAGDKERDLLDRVRGLPDGQKKAEETKWMIDRVRAFIGYREYPKYGMVSRYFVYKQALLGEARRLVRADVLRREEDIYFLTFEELHEVVRTNRADDELIRGRRDAFRSYRALTPPRVLTSDGEALAGAYRRADLPPGALVGLPVSAGTVDGRARVVRDLAEADLEPGDILVTAHTDPSWSPLFVAVTGLVTEVGGLMTHGAVVAREYGLPAVVGVDDATRLIRDGQQIRVNGTDGSVEILSGT